MTEAAPAGSSVTTSTLILVHGAWHRGACWAPLASALRDPALTVLAPDLPGHGDDPLPRQQVTLKRYVSSIVALLDAQPQPITLLGHSMAGIIVSAAAALRPEKIARLIYLCAYLPGDGESVFDLIALNRQHEPLTPIELALEMSSDKRHCTVAAEQIIPLFYPQAAPQLAAAAQAAFGSQATLPLAAGAKLTGKAFAQLQKTYICCTNDRVIPLHHQRRMLARQPCNTVLILEADHCPFLSCPDILAHTLRDCLTASAH